MDIGKHFFPERVVILWNRELVELLSLEVFKKRVGVALRVMV